MADKLDKARRSRNMSQIRSKNTSPELRVRQLIHGMGYRYRLHARELPGKPDVVLRRRKKAIFVHGCFWHQHTSCREGRLPGSNQAYWNAKLTRNVERDASHLRALKDLGWQVLTVWECELTDEQVLAGCLKAFLESSAVELCEPA